MTTDLAARLALAAAIVLAFIGVASADPTGDQSIDRLARVLALDEYQAGTVERILDEQRAQTREAIREHQKAEQDSDCDDDDGLRSRLDEIRSESLEKLRIVLSPEQLSKYEGFVAGRERHR